MDKTDIRVVEMTYSNNSNIHSLEKASPLRALFCFWLRFIGSVSGISFNSLLSYIRFLEDNT